METNLIGIHTISVSTEMINFAKTGIYRTVPMVLYKVNDEAVSHFSIKRPIEIIREDMDYGEMRNIVKSDDENISFLAMPGKSYNKMQQYVNQNVNKVIADMITHVVVKIINQLKQEDSNAKNIFFIDSMDTNKIIGRLGYVYLESKNNIIAFVTYKTGGLLTDVLNSGNEKLKFDIHYFKDNIHKRELKSEVIPNDFMESMTQTVFFNIPDKEGELSPLRCDILSQGIPKNEIQSKVKDISDILINDEKITLPFSESNGKNTNDMWVRIPRVLYDCIEAANIFRNVAEKILEE